MNTHGPYIEPGALGYDPPVETPDLVPVLIHDGFSGTGFVGVNGPIQIKPNTTIPFSLARHEFFHWIQRAGFDGNPLGLLSMLGGNCLSLDCQSILFWSEGSAEWATHYAQTVDPALDDDDGLYAGHVADLLRVPETSLDDRTDDREYGTFLLGEYLEEAFPSSGNMNAYCLTDPEPAECAVDPEPSMIRSVWEHIWSGNRVFDSINSVATNEGSDLSQVLQGFTRSNYLLDASLDGHRISGAYSDPDAAIWRQLLDAHLETEGDDPQVSGDNRPGHTPISVRRDAQAFDTAKLVEIQPGGASYVEIALPADGSAYHLEATVLEEDADLGISALAFSGYPSICAEIPIGTIESQVWTVASTNLILPDECTSVTVMLTHTNPLSWDNMLVNVRIWPYDTKDAFERTSVSGWGQGDGALWREASGLPRGTVAGGRGELAFSAFVSGERLVIGGDIEERLVIAELSDCTTFAGLAIGPVSINSSGVVSAFGAEPAQPPELDPCRPFYVRIGDAVKVWQATQRERDGADLEFDVSTPLEPSNVLTILGLGVDSAERVLIDIIEFEVQPWT